MKFFYANSLDEALNLDSNNFIIIKRHSNINLQVIFIIFPRKISEGVNFKLKKLKSYNKLVLIYFPTLVGIE